MSDSLFDCLVVGAGPAGLTATLYLSRFRHRVALIDGGPSRASLIPRTRNYPGFPGGISGMELLARLREQAAHYPYTTVQAWVDELRRDEQGFTAILGKQTLRARKVLLASGIADEMPDMEDVGQAIECGCIRLCPVCDAFEVVDRKVGMLLAPRGRVPHALFMRGFTADVTVFACDDHHCPTVAEREQLARAGVRVLDDRVARLERTPQGKARAVTTNGTEHEFDTVYPMLGIRARSELATALGAQCSEEGELVVDDHQRTSVPGLFAAGDVVTTLNQISVAVGQSAIAATAIHAELR